MIMPVGAKSFSEALRMCSEVFHVLKKVVPASGVGDEGGYAPNLDSDEDALKALVKAIELAGYKPGEDFKIAIDAASSEWWDEEQKIYVQPKSGKKLTQQQLVNMWKKFADNYPIISLEDGMAEDDWEGWKMLMDRLGKKIQLVGDDLFVTNVQHIKKGAIYGFIGRNGAGKTTCMRMIGGLAKPTTEMSAIVVSSVSPERWDTRAV